MKAEEIILAVSKNKSAMESLSVEVRREIDALVRENADKTNREKNDSLRQAEHAKNAANEHMMKEMLCIGEWGEKVPLKRRFALCEKNNPYTRFGDTREKVYCAIDLVRGYSSPYWGYYCRSSSQEEMEEFYKNRIKPILDAESKDEQTHLIMFNYYNFFKIEGDEERLPFAVINYEVDNQGKLIVTGRSESKSVKEHRDALKKEFENA